MTEIQNPKEVAQKMWTDEYCVLSDINFMIQLRSNLDDAIQEDDITIVETMTELLELKIKEMHK